MRDGVPASGGHRSPRVQSHFSVHDLAQQTRPVPRADGQEIRPLHGKGKGTARRAPYARRMEWRWCLSGSNPVAPLTTPL